MLESQVFANGSSTLPKAVRDGLSVEAGDTVRYVISGGCVEVLRILSDDKGPKIHGGDPACSRLWTQSKR